MTLRLLIKGNRLDAKRAAAARNVPFVFVRETHGTTVGRTPIEYRTTIERWFCEPPQQAPHPPGTLLHFVWEGLDGDFTTPELKQ
jgi:hypothetical protein